MATVIKSMNYEIKSNCYTYNDVYDKFLKVYLHKDIFVATLHPILAQPVDVNKLFIKMFFSSFFVWPKFLPSCDHSFRLLG